MKLQWTKTVYIFSTEEVTDGFCKSPPTTFDVASVLENMKEEDSFSEFGFAKNDLTEEMIQSGAEQLWWTTHCSLLMKFN